jgi:serine/threonine protein kinase
VIHCDLMTRNILVGELLNLKITDFGLARTRSLESKNNYHRVALHWASVEVLEHGVMVMCGGMIMCSNLVKLRTFGSLVLFYGRF